jgi:hypothetical protein
MKGIKAGFAAMLSILLVGGSCACGVQNPYNRTVTITTPLKEQQYMGAMIADYDAVNPIQGFGDFIFKGRIDKISEINVSYESITARGNKHINDNWRSSCDVTIENSIYGEALGIKEKIKVVFFESSRSVERTAFKLTEGQEYYFLTHVYNEQDKSYKNDLVKEYQLGDVKGSSLFCLFPVNDGIVSFRIGWPFEGAKQPVVTEENFDTVAGVSCTIDEKSFLEQFQAMIQVAKANGTSVLETTAPQPTSSAVD